MIQWSPDTSSRPSGGGYDYADSDITGFSLTHVAGTGCAAAGDMPILPVTGALGSDPGSDTESFSHSGETAAPGYYAVSLGNGTSVALTTTIRAGIGEFTFPATTSASLLFKLDDPATPYAASTLSVVGATSSPARSPALASARRPTPSPCTSPSNSTSRSPRGPYDATSDGPGGGYATFDTTLTRRSPPASESPTPPLPRPRRTSPPRSAGRPLPRSRRPHRRTGPPPSTRSASAGAAPRSRPGSTPRCTTPNCSPA